MSDGEQRDGAAPWLTRLMKGDPAGLGDLYDQTAAHCCQYALAMLGRMDRAEDAVQETFLLFARSRGRLKRLRSVRAHLFAILRHAVRRRLRRSRGRAAEPAQVFAPALPSGLSESLALAVESAFSRLPARHREILVLKTFQHRSFAEIADVTGFSEYTGMRRHRDALDQFRQSLPPNSLHGMDPEDLLRRFTIRSPMQELRKRTLPPAQAAFLDRTRVDALWDTMRGPLAVSARRWRVLAIVGFGLIILWLGYYAATSLIYGRKLSALRAQVKAQGSSLRLSDLAPKPVPREENAMRWYGPAVLLEYEPSGSRDESAKAPFEAYNLFLTAKPGERADVVRQRRTDLDAWLVLNADAVRLLHMGAKCDQGQTDLDYSAGYDMKLPHLASLRSSARLLSLEAWLAAADGDSHKALQAAWAALRVRRGVKDEPLLISFLVGVATDSIAVRTLQDTLPRIQPQPDDLRAILAESQSRDASSARRAMEGERAHVAGIFQLAREKGMANMLRGETGESARFVAAVMWLLNVRPRDEAYCLSYMNRLVQVASQMQSLPTSGWDALMDSVEGGLHRDAGSLSWRVFHPLSCVLLHALPQSLTEGRKNLARHSVVQCGLAAELYRLDHGAYPPSLDALTPQYLPALPQDLFTGKALIFKALPNGVLIYSVGPNATDDGGMESAPPGYQQTPPDDIVWRVERAAPTP